MSNYTDDKTWENYSSEAGAAARNLQDAIQRAKLAWDEFQRDLRSRTLVQFAIDIGKTQHTGTATAGAASTITLGSGASTNDDEYNNLDIQITGGTGAGQERTISDYVGSTLVATVSVAWTTAPDATSTYAIAYRGVHELNSCHGASKEVYDFVSNVASPTQGDRFFSWRPFT